MRGVITLVLILVLSGLGYVVYREDFSGKEKVSEKALFHLEESGIQKIELYSETSPWSHNGKGETLTLMREKANWKITSPVQGLADKATVTSFLNSLKNLNELSRVGPAKDEKAKGELELSKYGLEKPKNQVTVTETGENTPVRLAFGDPNPINTFQIFVKSSGWKDGIFVTTKSPLDFYDKPLWDWRQKRINLIETGEVKALEVRSHARHPDLKLYKSTEKSTFNHWMIDYPEKLIADDDAVEGYLSTISFLNAKGVVFESPDDKGAKTLLKTEPDYRIELTLGEGEAKKKHDILFWTKTESKDEVWVQSESHSHIFKIGHEEFSRMVRTVGEMREKRFLSHSVRDSSRKISLTFSTPQKSDFPAFVSYYRESGKWKSDAFQDSTQVESQKVDNFLDTLNSLKAEDFLQKLPSGAQKIISLKIESSREKGGDTSLFDLYSKKEKARTVIIGKRGDLRDFFVFPSNAKDKIPLSQAEFLSKKVKNSEKTLSSDAKSGSNNKE